jgi:vanillate O-demethylase ferredoxin subunit
MLIVRVDAITVEAARIRSFVLVDAAGGSLPAFEPGAHIDVQVPGGFTRQYSLCDPPGEDHYRIAVLDVPGGRGGSAAMHAQVRPGDLLRISHPRNTFPLARDARHSILVAGGIGITPILSMAETLQRQDASFELYYCTKSAGDAAFLDRVMPLVRAGRARLHHDLGRPGDHLDVAGMLQKVERGTHLYFCGPPGLMRAIRAATEHWPRGAVHWEYFGSTEETPPAASLATAYSVRLVQAKRVIRVFPGQSILQAVRSAGMHWDSSCEAGVCGTCRVRYLSGCPDHNDYILTDEERREFVLVCCARVTDDSLVLDM